MRFIKADDRCSLENHILSPCEKRAAVIPPMAARSGIDHLRLACGLKKEQEKAHK
jgi:hypothetical protein